MQADTTHSPESARWREGLAADVRFAFRSLARSPAFAFTVVASLALGVALAATALAVANAYLVRSLPYPDAERIHHVRYAPPGPWEPRGLTAFDWTTVSDVVDAAITISSLTFYVAGADVNQTARGLQVSEGFMVGLGVRPLLGRSFTAEEFKRGAEPVALIGHALWRDRYNADPAIVGKEFPASVEYPGGPPAGRRIIGVLPPGFWFGRDSRERVDVLVPLQVPTRTYMARLRAGVTVARAEARLTEEVRKVGREIPDNWMGVKLESVHARYVAGLKPILVGITVAAALVLLLACANVAVLLLLRAMRRQKELAVRVAIGAGRLDLARLLGAEAFLLCGAGFALGLGLTAGALQLLGPVIETELGKPPPAGAHAIALDWHVLAGVGAVGLAVVVALAFIPLIGPWQRRLADALRREGMSGTDGRGMRQVRSALIALEIAGSLVLLVGCGLMVRSAVNLMRTELGYRTEEVLRVRIVLPARTYADERTQGTFLLRLAEQFSTRWPVPQSLGASFPPFYEAHHFPIELGDRPAGGGSAGVMVVGAGHFEVLGIPLRQGRAFTVQDRLGSEPVALVSETLARRLWPDGGAIGQRIRSGERAVPDAPIGPWRTVVGVVADVRQTYTDSDVRDVYLPFLQVPTRFAALQLRTARPPPEWLALVRAAVAELDPHVAVTVASTMASEDRERARTRFMTALLAAFAGFAALLATVGIYGATAYAAQQREREVAIRIALGATGRAVIRLFLKDGGALVATGIGLGLLGSLGAARVLEHQVHGVEPFDALTLGTGAAVMGMIGFLAIWWPARRAAGRSPIAVLKEG